MREGKTTITTGLSLLETEPGYHHQCEYFNGLGLDYDKILIDTSRVDHTRKSVQLWPYNGLIRLESFGTRQSSEIASGTRFVPEIAVNGFAAVTSGRNFPSLAATNSGHCNQSSLSCHANRPPKMDLILCHSIRVLSCPIERSLYAGTRSEVSPFHFRRLAKNPYRHII